MFQALDSIINSTIRKIPPRSVDILSYKDILVYTLETVNKYPYSLIETSVVLRSKIGGSYYVVQVFLDRFQKPIYLVNGSILGRQFNVMHFDEKLQDAFGNNDMIWIQ